ncbi:hypothetical protein FTUN_2940 [Frigoriglobus tundricola]|uniref:Uncharacterized protein n=1 Tax=Frigoriglobus tundricola TaxID=2774151 RepID=A0A6M5YQ62_9BACT|nr:hypothetical protein FTUN_2940 [Frigoriglobus tundricola]
MNAKQLVGAFLAGTVLWFETVHADDHRLPHHHEETPNPGSFIGSTVVVPASGVATPWFGQ